MLKLLGDHLGLSRDSGFTLGHDFSKFSSSVSPRELENPTRRVPPSAGCRPFQTRGELAFSLFLLLFFRPRAIGRPLCYIWEGERTRKRVSPGITLVCLDGDTVSARNGNKKGVEERETARFARLTTSFIAYACAYNIRRSKERIELGFLFNRVSILVLISAKGEKKKRKKKRNDRGSLSKLI